MTNIKSVLKNHTFQIHTAAFILMILAPIPLYFAAQAGNTALIYLFLATVIAGNLLLVSIE